MYTYLSDFEDILLDIEKEEPLSENMKKILLLQKVLDSVFSIVKSNCRTNKKRAMSNACCTSSKKQTQFLT